MRRPGGDFRPLGMGRILIALLVALTGTAHADYDWGKWDYNLDYELDSRTGRYRPAYTHKSSKGDSTIWLDRDSGAKGSAKAEPLLVEVTWPRGWKVEKHAKTATARAADGSSFTVFASREGRARNADFLAEWRRRGESRFGAIAESDIRRYDAGVVALASVRASRTGRVLALCVVYDAGRALPIVIELPDLEAAQKHLAAMESFFGSIKLVRGKL